MINSLRRTVFLIMFRNYDVEILNHLSSKRFFVLMVKIFSNDFSAYLEETDLNKIDITTTINSIAQLNCFFDKSKKLSS